TSVHGREVLRSSFQLRTVASSYTGLNLGGLLTLGGSIAGLLAVIGGIAIASLSLITLGVLLYVERRYLSNQFGKEQLARWFERAIADLQSAPPTSPPTALGTVRVAELPLRSNIVTHAKMVIDRDIEVVVLGSP